MDKEKKRVQGNPDPADRQTGEKKKRSYQKPQMVSQTYLERLALACNKLSGGGCPGGGNAKVS